MALLVVAHFAGNQPLGRTNLKISWRRHHLPRVGEASFSSALHTPGVFTAARLPRWDLLVSRASLRMSSTLCPYFTNKTRRIFSLSSLLSKPQTRNSGRSVSGISFSPNQRKASLQGSRFVRWLPSPGAAKKGKSH